jgi:hypothetical protein
MRNLSGKQIGRLTVVGPAGKIKGRCAWVCKCSCGEEVIVLQQSLVKYAPTSSCGCLRTEALTRDLLGMNFGLWEVIAPSPKKKHPNGGAYWLCRCQCGSEMSVAAESLLSKRSISCGCSKQRPVCPQGHVIAEWGRDKTGMCRACIKNRNFLRNYGITLAEYIALWEFQKGLCAICGTPISIQLGRPGFTSGCRAELDHEHNPDLPQKQQVRGILCGGRWSGCNRKLGRLDKVIWLSSALAYVSNPPARTFFGSEITPKAAQSLQ